MDIVRNPEVIEHLTNIIRANLIGDEIILRACRYDIISREGYSEETFVVVWQSETRRMRQFDRGIEDEQDIRDCGTHRVSYNNIGASALFSGHYDCTRDIAFESLRQRMKNSPLAERVL